MDTKHATDSICPSFQVPSFRTCYILTGIITLVVIGILMHQQVGQLAHMGKAIGEYTAYGIWGAAGLLALIAIALKCCSRKSVPIVYKNEKGIISLMNNREIELKYAHEDDLVIFKKPLSSITLATARISYGGNLTLKSPIKKSSSEENLACTSAIYFIPSCEKFFIETGEVICFVEGSKVKGEILFYKTGEMIPIQSQPQSNDL